MRRCWPGILILGWLTPLVVRAADPDGASRLVFMIGEREYATEQTLPKFFEAELAPRGFLAAFVMAPADGPAKHDFPGLERQLATADLLVVSVRRRAPTESQLAAVRRHLEQGKPCVAIRTASHAFDSRGDRPTGHAEWLDFDRSVLGTEYSGHYGDEAAQVALDPPAAESSLLVGVEPWQTTRLYKNKLVSDDTELLLVGKLSSGMTEPVAWTHRYGAHRAKVFYTSMGSSQDFEAVGFRRLMLNGFLWALAPEADNSREH